MTTQITGREPRLSLQTNARGEQRLSLRKLASMLNILPPDAVSLPALDEMLRNEEFYVRYNAAQMLGRRGDREARLIIQNALNSGETPTRASVARHLYGFSWFFRGAAWRCAGPGFDGRCWESTCYEVREGVGEQDMKQRAHILVVDDQANSSCSVISLINLASFSLLESNAPYIIFYTSQFPDENSASYARIPGKPALLQDVPLPVRLQYIRHSYSIPYCWLYLLAFGYCSQKKNSAAYHAPACSIDEMSGCRLIDCEFGNDVG